jgi:ferrochelatase
MEWLKPETDAVMRELAAEGNDKVLLAPISFVAENIETLYDGDILYKKLASSVGINKFVRAKCMDEDPAFIDALAGIVLKNLG